MVLVQIQEVRLTSGSQWHMYMLGHSRWSVIVNSEENGVLSLIKQIKVCVN